MRQDSKKSASTLPYSKNPTPPSSPLSKLANSLFNQGAPLDERTWSFSHWPCGPLSSGCAARVSQDAADGESATPNMTANLNLGVSSEAILAAHGKPFQKRGRIGSDGSKLETGFTWTPSCPLKTTIWTPSGPDNRLKKAGYAVEGVRLREAAVPAPRGCRWTATDRPRPPPPSPRPVAPPG
jgi:hypothetical protein